MDAPPKRKYTVTPKVAGRGARANLAKANAVPKAIRYRSTEERRLACRANLLLAHGALRVNEIDDWTGEPRSGESEETDFDAPSVQIRNSSRGERERTISSGGEKRRSASG